MHKVNVEQDAVATIDQDTDVKILTFRRGSGVFFRDFPVFMAQHKIREIVSMCQSESEGNLTLTIAYR